MPCGDADRDLTAFRVKELHPRRPRKQSLLSHPTQAAVLCEQHGGSGEQAGVPPRGALWVGAFFGDHDTPNFDLEILDVDLGGTFGFPHRVCVRDDRGHPVLLDGLPIQTTFIALGGWGSTEDAHFQAVVFLYRPEIGGHPFL